MPITKLPVYEADADPERRTAMTDREIYERLKPPTSIVVRYGLMKAVAEYPYDGPAKPGCGSKLVARTHRGLEVVEMLTTTCSNSGCGKSVSRQEMLEYIENSGGSDYPFRTDGRILRVATPDDLARWTTVQTDLRGQVRPIKAMVAELGLPMKIVDLEGTLSRETVTVYFLSEERVDFRELVRRIAGEMKTRIEMRQVGARDEARLVADYERCGQHCCCKNFLKVLKPVSMRSAKTQKGTIDPLKISGRCGRLMCCLRYEDETYEDLKKRLPKNRTRVGTPHGPGLVIDSKILVQLVLVQLEADGREVAVPVEELCDPDACPPPEAEVDPLRGLSTDAALRRGREGSAPRQDRHRSRLAAGEGAARGADARAPRERPPEPKPSSAEGIPPAPADASTEAGEGGEGTRKKRRRRRRRGRGGEGSPGTPEGMATESGSTSGAGPLALEHGGEHEPDSERGDEAPEDREAGDVAPGTSAADGGTAPRKRRRRRRRRGGGGGGGDPTGGGPAPSGGTPSA